MAYNAVLLHKILFQITCKFCDQRTTILPLSFIHVSVCFLVHSLFLAYKTPTRYNPLYQENINNKYYLSAFVLHKRQLGHLGCVLETYQRHLRGKEKASFANREAAWGLLYWNSVGFSTQQSHLKSLVADETEKPNLYAFYITAKALIFFLKPWFLYQLPTPNYLYF